MVDWAQSINSLSLSLSLLVSVCPLPLSFSVSVSFSLSLSLVDWLSLYTCFKKTIQILAAKKTPSFLSFFLFCSFFAPFISNTVIIYGNSAHDCAQSDITLDSSENNKTVHMLGQICQPRKIFDFRETINSDVFVPINSLLFFS